MRTRHFVGTSVQSRFATRFVQAVRVQSSDDIFHPITIHFRPYLFKLSGKGLQAAQTYTEVFVRLLNRLRRHHTTLKNVNVVTKRAPLSRLNFSSFKEWKPSFIYFSGPNPLSRAFAFRAEIVFSSLTRCPPCKLILHSFCKTLRPTASPSVMSADSTKFWRPRKSSKLAERAPVVRLTPS